MMSDEDWCAKSYSICDKVTSHPFFLKAENIYCYIDVRREVGTREIIETAWSMGKRVAAPRIYGDEMEFFYFDSFEELTMDSFRIPAPNDSLCAKAENPLVIMPGAVFDYNRHRIGYGKGYYDKYLDKYPKAKTIALSFAFQVQETIPFEEHDICPEYLITEEKIYGEEFTE